MTPSLVIASYIVVLIGGILIGFRNFKRVQADVADLKEAHTDLKADVQEAHDKIAAAVADTKTVAADIQAVAAKVEKAL
jgi:hypothetical protein